MKQNESLSPEIKKQLLATWEQREKFLYSNKSKAKISEVQSEFLIGCCAGIDKVLENKLTCMPADWYVQILRGEKVTG